MSLCDYMTPALEDTLMETSRFLEKIASMGGPLSGNAMEHARRLRVEANRLRPPHNAAHDEGEK